MDKTNLEELMNAPQQKWDTLANKKIYFGHQSVGYNIVEGIQEIIANNPNIKLNIKVAKNPSDFNAPVFAHSPVGKNRDPFTKIADFKAIMDSGVGRKVDIAFFKLCYIDIDQDTDLDRLFNYYKENMRQIQENYPNAIFIHCSVPVRTTNTSIKAAIMRLLGKTVWGDKENIARNKYNQKLANEYGSSGRFFDLAKYEATSPNGALTHCAKDGKDCLALYSKYSEDGGHLSSLGRKAVSTKLLWLIFHLLS
ncbi:MAG: hypothetical protein WC549_04500 [Actinomycetota bacterium]